MPLAGALDEQDLRAIVAWALDTGPASLRADVQEFFAGELAAGEGNAAMGVSGFEERLLGHGMMGPGLRAALRARVLREVIAPCAEALLHGHGTVAHRPSCTASP